MKKTTSVLIMSVTCAAFLPACGPEGAAEESAGETSGLPVGPEVDSLGTSKSELTVSTYTWGLGIHGGWGGNPGALSCPAGSVAVGISGRSGEVIDQLSLSCANMYSDGNLGPASPVGPVGGGGGNAFTMLCPTNQAVVGFHGGSGDVVDRVGIYCSTISNWRASTSVQYTSWEAGGGGGNSYSETTPAGYVVTRLNVRHGDVIDQFQGIGSYISP